MKYQIYLYPHANALWAQVQRQEPDLVVILLTAVHRKVHDLIVAELAVLQRLLELGFAHDFVVNLLDMRVRAQLAYFHMLVEHQALYDNY